MTARRLRVLGIVLAGVGALSAGLAAATSRAAGEVASFAGSAMFSSVSCTSANACTAVGASGGAAAARAVLAVRWTGSRWSIEQAVNPPGMVQSEFSRVSCASSTSCIAVGAVAGRNGRYVPLAGDWNGSQWSLTRTRDPCGGPGGLNSVSCPSPSA